jgi:hypothetical protein
MNCVILQPSYVPWRGYFHQVRRADVFVFYDDVQFDKHGWRNRNRIKTSNGAQWLTVPVHAHGAVQEGVRICDVLIDWDQYWARKHLNALMLNYSKAPYFRRYAELVRSFYERRDRHLVDLTISTTTVLAAELGICNTRFVRSSALRSTGTGTERLVGILKEVGATHYISGPSARDYLDERQLLAAGISLEYMVYDYPVYAQLYPPFDGAVSVLDLLFMTGPDAPNYIWGGGAAGRAIGDDGNRNGNQ